MTRLFGILAGLALVGGAAWADTVRPVTVHVRETEPERVLVQWRVPAQLPVPAIPTPVLGAPSQAVGERTVAERPGGWLLQQTYECPKGLPGQVVRMEFPLPNATVSTLLRIDLMSGEQYVHMLAPGEDSWSIPAAAGGEAPAFLRAARDAVLAGADHFARNPLHFAFLLSLAMGPLASALRLVSVFSGAQLLAVIVASISGFALAPIHAEIGIAVAAALLVREALRASARPGNRLALAGAAGLVHGLGLAGLASGASAGAALVQGAVIVLGFDAALGLGLLAVFAVGRILPHRLARPPFRTVGAYAVAGLALGLALSAPAPRSLAAPWDRAAGARMPDFGTPGGGGAAGSRALAARAPDATLQSFVSISAFEVRHEVLVKLVDVVPRLGLDPGGVLSVEEQRGLLERVQEMVTTRSSVAIDGGRAEPTGRSAAFVAASSRGVLRRPAPVPEPVGIAWIGVTTVYLTDATPHEVRLVWEEFDLAVAIPATMTDPEVSRSEVLSPGDPVLPWINELSHDPVPVVGETAVEPGFVWVPFVSLALLGLAGVLAGTAARGRQPRLRVAVARIVVATAVLCAPVSGAGRALSTPPASVPSEAGARRILASILPNVYRAFEFPAESVAYDRLALSVTGEALSEVYLGHRAAIEAEERGGARTRIESVEVTEVRSVEPASDGFAASATWTVGGTVTHFGHSHFRLNRYDAEITVIPVDGTWKIRSIDVLDEERLR